MPPCLGCPGPAPRSDPPLHATGPVTVTVTKRALLSSSLSVPRSTVDDENSSHNHFIIEEDSFTAQLTFSDGN